MRSVSITAASAIVAIGLAAVTTSCGGARTSDANAAHAPAFVAVIATDAKASADWYAAVFHLEEIRITKTERFDQRMLAGDRFMIEIIESIPPAPEAPDRAVGLFKFGVTVDDFDAYVARLRADGVAFMGDGRVIYDEDLGLRSTILLDPDGNRIQIFGAGSRGG